MERHFGSLTCSTTSSDRATPMACSAFQAPSQEGPSPRASQPCSACANRTKWSAAGCTSYGKGLRTRMNPMRRQLRARTNCLGRYREASRLRSLSFCRRLLYRASCSSVRRRHCNRRTWRHVRGDGGSTIHPSASTGWGSSRKSWARAYKALSHRLGFGVHESYRGCDSQIAGKAGSSSLGRWTSATACGCVSLHVAFAAPRMRVAASKMLRFAGESAESLAFVTPRMVSTASSMTLLRQVSTSASTSIGRESGSMRPHVSERVIKSAASAHVSQRWTSQTMRAVLRRHV